MHNLERLEFMRHLVACFKETQNVDGVVILIRKINRLMVSGA